LANSPKGLIDISINAVIKYIQAIILTLSVICQIKCPFGSGYGSKGDGTVYGKKHQDEFIQMRSPVSVAEFMENSR
jgi:hypothetical protein